MAKTPETVHPERDQDCDITHYEIFDSGHIVWDRTKPLEDPNALKVTKETAY
ncbi:MAG: hypothetical protein ACD_65C00357G0002 [uncultured bacterium]|nr:MAG: hypothetical protein ACD_65C00357G0002 [uncultured bacterium]